jgi:hypothetical protein
LLLYEAAIGRDRHKLEQVLFDDEDRERVTETRQRLKVEAEATGTDYEDVFMNTALFQLIEFASGALISYCYPVISYPPRYSHLPEDAAPPMTPDQLARGWGARNLLGAMGLQLYWLITSEGKLDRCKYCGRIISHTSPVPGGQTTKSRKTRSDKSFCNSRCRQNHHYHNRQKPQHRDGSNGDNNRSPA